MKIGASDLDEVLEKGARWMVENGYGDQRDVEFAEAGGALEGADAGRVSERASSAGGRSSARWAAATTSWRSSTWTRFIDEAAARVMGLAAGQVVVLIHSGSRGLGHQVCTDYVSTKWARR